MKPLFFLAVIPAVLLLLSSGRPTLSKFTSLASLSGNSFTASSEFPTTPIPTVNPSPTPTASTPSPTPIPAIVINEVASAITGNDEWIEIFNTTSSPVDISGWKIRDNSASEEDIIPSVTPIPANGYGVIMASDGNSSIIPVSAIPLILSDTTIGNNLSNGGDRVLLKTPNGIIADQMSWGSDTSVFATPPAAPESTQSLIRKPNGIDTDTSSDWQTTSTPSAGLANP